MEKKYIDKLGLLYIKDKKLLLARNYGKEVWYIPGGQREAGESDHEALCREIQEELCVAANVESLQPFGTFEAQAYGKPEGVMVRVTAYTGEITGACQPGSEVQALDWF